MSFIFLSHKLYVSMSFTSFAYAICSSCFYHTNYTWVCPCFYCTNYMWVCPSRIYCTSHKWEYPSHFYLCWSSYSWYVPITYRGPRNERCNTTTLCYKSNNSAMFLARENKKSKTYLQLMSFIQITKTTNIYIYMKTRSAWCYIIHYYITLSF